MTKISECRSEVDPFFSDWQETDGKTYATCTKLPCPIIAPFTGSLPRGGGRVINSPRILFEETSDYLGDVD
jgi:hypothetical protein